MYVVILWSRSSTKPSVEVAPITLPQKLNKRPKLRHVVTCFHEIYHIVTCNPQWKRNFLFGNCELWPVILTFTLHLWLWTKDLDAVIINRLKIGHSRLTQSYLLSGEDQPTCTKCDTVLTVKHILLDFPELQDVRFKYFTASSLKDIFESVDNQNIIGFIKDAHFYHQL